ncbi:uncharacterized protein [Panulirus ornatus]|uniref:uncharacterized protein n=1 Tax=Panulirus ornatus TaxID=150431 RepID=UPI003A8487C1
MTDDYDNVFFQALEKTRDQVTKCAFMILEYVEDDALKAEHLSDLENCLISCVEAERQVALSKEAAKEAVKRAVDEESELPDSDKYDEVYLESLEELEQDRDIQEVIDNAPSVKTFREQLLAQSVPGGSSNADDSEELVTTQHSINIIDPISKKVMTDPVRNKHCGHVYDRSSVVDMIKVKKRKGFKCPSMGCGYREPLKLHDLEDALDVKRKIIFHQKKYGNQ